MTHPVLRLGFYCTALVSSIAALGCAGQELNTTDGVEVIEATEALSPSFLKLSRAADRSGAVTLNGQSVTGNVYIFAPNWSILSRVEFFLDDTKLQKAPFQTENAAPFDFAGTNDNGTPRAFDTSALSAGNHTITVRIRYTTGVTDTAIAVFTKTAFTNTSTPAATPVPTPPPTAPSTPTSEPSGWNLVFQEDFNGTAVNKAEWGMYDSPGHAGNGLRKPSAFSVANGLLTVTAQMVNGVLVSGGMAHVRNYKYGRFEFRVRTAADPSGAVSGVVLTWPQTGQWPVDGENDMYETGNGPTRSNFHTFIHYGSDNRQYYFKHPVDATQWHTVAMEWEANAIRMYRNGELVWTLTDTAAIPDVAHHMTIQLDAFKTSIAAPTTMQVDWVKIYQR